MGPIESSGRRRLRSYRVAQRVALVFLGVLIVPITILSLVFYGQIRDFLEQQAESHLRALSKGYALGIYDRLLLAREEFERTTPPVLPLSASTMFDRIELHVGTSELALPDEARTILRIEPSTATRNPTFVFLRRLSTELGDSTANGLLGRLNPEFLWAETEQLPYGAQVCVYALDRIVLHCGGDTVETHQEHGRFDQLSNSWELFLDAQFGHPPIRIEVSQPRHIALAVLDDVQQSAPLVALLLLAALALVTAIQVRRQLTPLNELVDKTRRLAAGDFSARNTLRRDDEFGELAVAFNDMADLLERRFAILSTLQTVDRTVADQEDIHNVVGKVIDLALSATAAEAIGVLMFSESGREWLVLRHCVRGFRKKLHESLIHMDDHLRKMLIEPDKISPDQLNEAMRDLVIPLSEDARHCLVSRASESTSAWIIAWYADDKKLDSENHLFIDQLADRLSIADSLSRKTRKLYENAHYDELTGLPNRHLLKDRVGRALLRAEQEGGMIAVHFVDLDGFKAINDKLGHSQGDVLLKAVGQNLRDHLRETDCVGRFGGDEFVVIQSELQSRSDAEALARKILDAVHSPVDLAGSPLTPSASVGISICPDDARSVEDMLRFADAAMYDAKRKVDSFSFFREEMDDQLNIAFQFEENLERALEEDEFTLVFHPQIDLHSGQVVGAEALLRWRQPDGRLVPPDFFIPLAEQAGRIVSIGDWVLQQAISAGATLTQAFPLIRIAINVAPAQLRSPGFSDQVLGHCAKAGLNPDRIELEITESGLLRMEHNPQSVLTRLREAGVTIALDDFGTGYSSLSYLRQLPIDVIKIDQMFMVGVAENQEARTIISTVVELGRGFNKAVIAEGIETEAQAYAVRELDVNTAQGFYFAKPLPLDELLQRMHATDGRLWKARNTTRAEARPDRDHR